MGPMLGGMLVLMAMRAGVGQLTNLRELRVSGNRLAGLPREVGALVKLHRLAADNNLLTSLPRAPQAFNCPKNMDSTRLVFGRHSMPV